MRGRDRAAAILERLFAPIGPLPRKTPGYKAAAKRLGLTSKQVKDWLPKTRKNRRGAQPTKAELGNIGINWSSPFGPRKPPEEGE
jgi:hypothetical protein